MLSPSPINLKRGKEYKRQDCNICQEGREGSREKEMVGRQREGGDRGRGETGGREIREW